VLSRLPNHNQFSKINSLIIRMLTEEDIRPVTEKSTVNVRKLCKFCFVDRASRNMRVMNPT
jgi:hypothetical protein